MRFTNLMKDVCFDVELEIKLQLLDGESANNRTTTEDEAPLDIKANCLWETRFNRPFFDVKISNPYVPPSVPLIQTTTRNHRFRDWSNSGRWKAVVVAPQQDIPPRAFIR